MKHLDGFRSCVASLLTVGALSLAGCGGSGGSGNSGNPGGGGGGNNPYAGTYNGEFVDQTDFIGTFSLTVTSAGAINGQFGSVTPISFTGNISNSGSGSLTDSNGTFEVTLGSSGKTTLGGGIGTPANGAFITLVTNPAASTGGFEGSYAGTVQNTTIGHTGIIAFTVSSSGAVAGVDLFDVNNTPTLEPISGSINSTGQLSYTVAGTTVSGAVSLSGTTLSGSLSESNGDSANISVTQLP